MEARVRVREVMTEDVQVVSPGATILEAAQLMDRLNVGVLPVCDGEKLSGMITDRDITVRATAANKVPDGCRVDEVMTAVVEYVFDDDGVQNAMEKMQARQIRRLPVIDRAQRLVGIVSLGDLATDVDRQIDEVADTLEKVSSPSEPDRSPVLPNDAPEGEMDKELVQKLRRAMTRGPTG
jgi:CBS domain-containing protein